MKPHTVLIVEDVYQNYLLLKEILNMRNYDIIYAENGSIALDYVRHNPKIKLVLMDLKMPVMNGFEATKSIKNIRPELPVIAQTAYFLNNEPDEAMKAGCNDYITKPINFQLLFNKIDSIVPLISE